ncbi:hypothetical protein [Terriglobus sp.]|uniref:hypothetical protein n=1 Tax=Terriglobus sp. TaxID=1889013 RepID=UPI003B00AA5F
MTVIAAISSIALLFHWDEEPQMPAPSVWSVPWGWELAIVLPLAVMLCFTQ